MKISDYKINEFLKNNPEAESIPVNEIKEEEAPTETNVTLEDALTKISGLDEKINSIVAAIDALRSEDKKDTSDDTLKALSEEVKTMKEEAQKRAQADSTLPEPESADDILTKFLTGGI